MKYTAILVISFLIREGIPTSLPLDDPYSSVMLFPRNPGTEGGRTRQEPGSPRSRQRESHQSSRPNTSPSSDASTSSRSIRMSVADLRIARSRLAGPRNGQASRRIDAEQSLRQPSPSMVSNAQSQQAIMQHRSGWPSPSSHRGAARSTSKPSSVEQHIQPVSQIPRGRSMHFTSDEIRTGPVTRRRNNEIEVTMKGPGQIYEKGEGLRPNGPLHDVAEGQTRTLKYSRPGELIVSAYNQQAGSHSVFASGRTVDAAFLQPMRSSIQRFNGSIRTWSPDFGKKVAHFETPKQSEICKLGTTTKSEDGVAALSLHSQGRTCSETLATSHAPAEYLRSAHETPGKIIDVRNRNLGL